MSHDFQLEQYMLSFKAFFIAVSRGQALLILLDFDHHASSAPVVEIDIGEQYCFGIAGFVILNRICAWVFF